MAATSDLGSTSKNFYNIADGMLYENRSDVLDGYEEIPEKDIERARSKYENIDLRGKYVVRDSDKYKYKHYFTGISGTIQNIEKVFTDGYGSFLKITLIDQDGEISEVSTNFYGKYSNDILNRLLSANLSQNITFRPYSIPSEYAPEAGSVVKYNAQGVGMIQLGEKVPQAFNKENGLPPTERVKNPTNGEMITSRVNRIDFLWNKIQPEIEKITLVKEAVSADPFKGDAFSVDEKEKQLEESLEDFDMPDDLPF